MKLDLLTFELDIVKARKGAMVGEERVWHGVTYVKTISGWRPKSKEKAPKAEEPSTPRMKKIEDPAKVREKQLEEFASRAKDSQLEAAIKDPKQNQEVKDIAQAELDERTGGAVEEEKKKRKRKEHVPEDAALGLLDKFDSLKAELEETLKKNQETRKNKEEEFKVIKKTGINVDGKKIFITMNEDNTGYVAKGSGVNMSSEKGESLSSFKEKVKSEAEKLFGAKKEESQKLKEQLESDLGRKLDENFKFVKKTGITVDGHQIFITMDGAHYIAKGFGLRLKSRPEESLKDFKERVKESLQKKLDENANISNIDAEIRGDISEQQLTKNKEIIETLQKEVQGKESEALEKFKESPFLKTFNDEAQLKDFLKGYLNEEDRYKYMNKYRNNPKELVEERKQEIIGALGGLKSVILETPKQTQYFIKTYKKIKKTYFKNPDPYSLAKLARGLSWEGSHDDIYDKFESDDKLPYAFTIYNLAIIQNFVEAGYEPICAPMFYTNYEGKEYGCYDYSILDNPSEDSKWGGYLESAYEREMRNATATDIEKEALNAYAGNMFYRFLTEYMYRGKDNISEEAKLRRGEMSMKQALKAAEVYSRALNTYIDKNPINESVVLSRRVHPTANEEIYTQMSQLRKGDTGVFKSVQSFSWVQKAMFGEFQITLLAEKGDAIAIADNAGEYEFISKQDIKFEVLETGYNSMVIKFIDRGRKIDTVENDF